jgi:FMN-dependent NADH-azoreductase
MQYVNGEGQFGFFCSYGDMCAWDVENAWLISLFGIFGCSQMKGIQISHIERKGKHSSLMVDKTHHGWWQRLL